MATFTDADVALLQAKQATKDFEGFRSSIYKDTKGKRTVGYGFNIDDPTISSFLPKDVIFGRRPLNKPEADKAFDVLYERAKKDAMSYAGNAFDSLAPQAQDVLVDMSYNMGLKKLSGFKKMRAALESGDMDRVALEMQDSEWFKQVGNRSKKHYETIKGLSRENIPDDFKSAFFKARGQGLATFVWNGKKYTTEIK